MVISAFSLTLSFSLYLSLYLSIYLSISTYLSVYLCLYLPLSIYLYLHILELQVIAADGEYKSSKSLKEAADVIARSPVALQLRLNFH